MKRFLTRNCRVVQAGAAGSRLARWTAPSLRCGTSVFSFPPSPRGPEKGRTGAGQMAGTDRGIETCSGQTVILPRPEPQLRCTGQGFDKRWTWQKRPKTSSARQRTVGPRSVDLRFCDLPASCSTSRCPSASSRGGFAEGYGSTALHPGLPGHPRVRHAPDAGPDHRRHGPFPGSAHPLLLNCFIEDPITRNPIRETRATSQEGAGPPRGDRIADTSYWGPSWSSTSSTRRRSTRTPTRVTTTSTPWKGSGDRAPPVPRYRPRYKKGTSRSPWTVPGPRSEMLLTMIAMGVEVEIQHHESAPAGQARSTCVQPLLPMADKVNDLQVRGQVHCLEARQAATFMPKPLFATTARHARPLVVVEGQRAALLRCGRATGP